MALHDRIQKKRDDLLAAGKVPVPDKLQGVTKNRIRGVLTRIDRNYADIVDVVFALLDDRQPNWFASAPDAARFCDGASTAQIGCHVGILQRGKGKLDREGRDYWLKPLWEVGAVEKVYLNSSTKEFISGHPVAKSSNCAYRLAPSFVKILKAADGDWEPMLAEWISANSMRERLNVQSSLAEASRAAVDTKHSDLIRSAIEVYAPRFLPGFQVLYVDDADGDRITEGDKQRLGEAGVALLLSDSMPDALLWHPQRDWLWVIEAVTSDGEIDFHKVEQFTALAQRAGKAEVGFTTAYATWRAAATRQGRYKNASPNTYIWIQEDPSKHFLVSSSSVFAGDEGQDKP